MAGDACYGVYMPAFGPGALELSIPGCQNIIHGTLQSSYFSNPIGGTKVPANFQPDELLPGTAYDGACYGLEKWFVCRSRPQAMAARALLAGQAIEARKREIAGLEKFL